jgi:RimJ/RimL family protein N-acetyltransferase
MTEPTLAVREMELDDVDYRIEYFHNASDEHLRVLGVDRDLLPSREQWRDFYEQDFARPIAERANYSLLWLLDDERVGFSTTDRIVFGVDAFMHLHMVAEELRGRGLGSAFVRLSTDEYFKVLRLERIYCEPKAVNVAPNRALQNAGFSYLFSHETTPGSYNFRQITTRWVLERPHPHSLSRKTS